MTWTVNRWRSTSVIQDALACTNWRVGSAWLVAGLIACAAHADPLLDFRTFNAPDPGKRAISLPTVSWIVHPQAETYCQHAQPKDGFLSRPEGCVFWQTAASRCTLVTRPLTTHSQLGHLLLHCMEGK